jgi:dTMP kinase
VFVVFEGGEGAGKSTQVDLLAEWLRDHGVEVVVTREPGGTPLGERLREILLAVETGVLAPRTEALLYAADRAEHVASLVRPALDRGAVVVSDRYVDSSIAYQGAGRALEPADVARLSEWGTDGLVPDLTVLLDLDPEVGHRRFATPADRLESEPLDFHRRVREGFLALAGEHPARYLVVDATEPAELVSEIVRARVANLLGIGRADVGAEAGLP